MGLLLWLRRAPECWWPGRFDLWGHSHSWWHAAIVAAVYVYSLGLEDYYVFLQQHPCVASTRR